MLICLSSEQKENEECILNKAETEEEIMNKSAELVNKAEWGLKRKWT